MDDTSKLKVTRVRTADGWRLELNGDLTQRGQLGEELSGLRGMVVLDLDGVHRVTSFGVREWIDALKLMSASYLGFVRCRPLVVTQFNLVVGFASGGHLISFYAPYVCPECDEENDLLVDLRTDYQVVLGDEMPEVKCKKCQRPCEFDEVADHYFSYVRTLPPPFVPGPVAAMIDDRVVTSSVNLRIKKEVVGSLTAIWFAGPLEELRRFRRSLSGLEGLLICEFSEVTALEQSGLTELIEILSASDSDVYLSRVPERFVELVADTIRAHPRVQLISILTEARCASCRVDARLEFGPTLGGSDATPRTEVRCAECGLPARDVTLTDSRRIESFLKTPPQNVASYVFRRSPGASPQLVQADSDSGLHSRHAPYKVVRRLGMGGMGEVFLARVRGPEGFSKDIVLKRMLPKIGHDRGFTEMFLQEARVAAQISHPNVVQVYDLGKDRGTFYIAMEYVNGCDLRRLLKSLDQHGETMPPAIACRIIADCCAGLHAAHGAKDPSGRQLQLVHRDVSPPNILVSSDGIAKVTDFGVAKASLASNADDRALRGKIAYMAPEQLDDGGSGVCAATDVFAVGLVFFECLKGSHPFSPTSEQDMVTALRQEPLPSIDLDTDLDVVELNRIIARATAKRLSDRYAGADEMRADLERVLVAAGVPVTQDDVARWLSDHLPRLTEMVDSSFAVADQETVNLESLVRARSDERGP